MELGFAIPAQAPGLTAADVLRAAERVERHGLDSIWVLDRLVYDSFSPLVTLAAVAAVTARPRLGTAVLVAPMYNPFHLAKDAATVDQLSHGRLTLGLGIGVHAEDFAAAGVPYRARARRLEETLVLLRQAWAGQPIRHHGRIFEADLPAMGPAPSRPSGIPIWMGAYAEPAIDRAARLADGYIAGARGATWARRAVASFRRAAVRHGRDPAAVPTACLIYAALGPDVQAMAAQMAGYFEAFYGRVIFDPAKEGLVGPTDAAAARLHEYDDIGLDLVIVVPTLRHPEQVDRLADAVAAYRG
ncbi:MAG: LLM class flavin-dependent oxidoreductase [Chloroflexota bacterium]|nr:LLM class flavin-dependent oxidoreductase [Chloroflexota bacterium]